MLAMVVVLATTGLTQAAVVDFNGTLVDVEYSVGSGANAAMLVVDFGSGDSYAFGYRWDGSAVSEDMLVALDGDGLVGLLDVQSHSTVYGVAIDGFAYDGHSIVSDNWITTFPGFWWSGAEETTDWSGTVFPAWDGDGETWAIAQQGAGLRTLHNGFWDAWTQEYVANGYDPTHTPNAPLVSNAPEPATLSLLAVAGIGVLIKRRKR